MKWSKTDIKLLRKSYPTMEVKDLVKLFNRKIHTIVSQASRYKIKRKKIFNKNEKNGMWKGYKVGYNALHSWIRVRKKKPNLCQNCKKNKPYDLANISGKYKRDIKDYKWVCRKCHMEEDGRLLKLNKK